MASLLGQNQHVIEIKGLRQITYVTPSRCEERIAFSNYAAHSWSLFDEPLGDENTRRNPKRSFLSVTFILCKTGELGKKENRGKTALGLEIVVPDRFG
jgi:hypothetical protein